MEYGKLSAGLISALHTLENDGRQEVTLKEEIEVLERYLEIERIRFEDRLRVTLEVEPETLSARVPNFALQPLVENAIRHGIAPRAEGGKVQLSATRHDDMLSIVLRDDGPGLQPAGTPRREGIGVSNTRARLEQLYGHAHRFEMKNAPEGGLVVTMSVPYRTE